MSLHIGTSGWAYKEWKPDFYPADLPQRAFLSHYGSVMSGCEINATFYRLQAPTTMEKWNSETPKSFRFAVKMHRRLTHSAELGDADWQDFLARFLESLAPLGERLGPLLIQFPPHRRRDDGLLKEIVGALPPGQPFACEFRHESWDDDALDELLAPEGGTRCLADTTGTPPAALPPGSLAYVRLRADRYAGSVRDEWADLIARESEMRPTYVFAKHKDVPAGDPETGVGLAQWLLEGR